MEGTRTWQMARYIVKIRMHHHHTPWHHYRQQRHLSTMRGWESAPRRLTLSWNESPLQKRYSHQKSASNRPFTIDSLLVTFAQNLGFVCTVNLQISLSPFFHRKSTIVTFAGSKKVNDSYFCRQNPHIDSPQCYSYDDSLAAHWWDFFPRLTKGT